MNSVQTIGWTWIIFEFAEWLTPKEIDKASKKVFGVKARKVNVPAARKAIAKAKKVQKEEEFDYGQQEIVDLEGKITFLLNSGKLGKHNNEAINVAFEALTWIKDECRIQ